MKKTIGAAVALALSAGLVWAAAGRQELPKPGKEHDFLKRFEGTWNLVAKFQPAPGAAVCEGRGEERNVLGCGGLWLIIDSKSEMMGAPFHGHALMGYDTDKKKYVGVFVDNTSSSLFLFEGTLDASGKVCTTSGEGKDPMTGKMVRYTLVYETKDADTNQLTFKIPGPDGKEFSMGVITYTRKK